MNLVMNIRKWKLREWNFVVSANIYSWKKKPGVLMIPQTLWKFLKNQVM